MELRVWVCIHLPECSLSHPTPGDIKVDKNKSVCILHLWELTQDIGFEDSWQGSSHKHKILENAVKENSRANMKIPNTPE